MTMVPFHSNTDYLALDFDGVIADSVEECLVVGHNAYALTGGESDAIHHLSDLDSETIEEAKRLRSFIRSGQDYVYIFKVLDLNVQISNQSEYDRFTSEHQEDHDRYFDLFYRVRTEMLDRDAKAWAELNPLYPGMKEFLDAFDQDRLFIVTTKKVEYAQTILQNNQITLSTTRMYQATREYSKQDILSKLAEELRVKPLSIHFVDDQIDTLTNVQPTGVQCYLAAWGYNNPDQVYQARVQNIPVLSLTSFLDRF